MSSYSTRMSWWRVLGLAATTEVALLRSSCNCFGNVGRQYTSGHLQYDGEARLLDGVASVGVWFWISSRAVSGGEERFRAFVAVESLSAIQNNSTNHHTLSKP